MTPAEPPVQSRSSSRVLRGAPVSRAYELPGQPGEHAEEITMLSKILMASAGVLLLAACQQQNQAVSAPSSSMSRNYAVYFDTDKATLSPESTATIAQAA